MLHSCCVRYCSLQRWEVREQTRIWVSLSSFHFLVCGLTFFHFSLFATHYSFVHSVVNKSRYLRRSAPRPLGSRVGEVGCSWCGLGSGGVCARPVWRLLTGYNVTSYEVAECNLTSLRTPHCTIYTTLYTIHYTIQYNHYTLHNITINIPWHI